MSSLNIPCSHLKPLPLTVATSPSKQSYLNTAGSTRNRIFKFALENKKMFHEREKSATFTCMWQPEDHFLCPALPVVEAHPAGQRVLQFTAGREEHQSEPVTSLSPVLPQTLTNHWLNRVDQELLSQLYSLAWGNCRSHCLQLWPQLSNFSLCLSLHSLTLLSVEVNHNGRVMRFWKCL